MVNGDVETVVYEKHLAHPEALFHILEFLDDLFHRPDYPPTGLIRGGCGNNGGVGKVTELGQYPDAEARLAEAARAIADWLQQMGA